MISHGIYSRREMKLPVGYSKISILAHTSLGEINIGLLKFITF